MFVMSPDRAARLALRGIRRGRRTIVPGPINRAIALAAWLFPRRMVGAVTGWLLGPARPALPPAGAP
jgi:short-subunit dehydrogenase